MTERDFNPYTAPTTEDLTVDVPESSSPRAAFVLVLVVTVLYTGFIVLLLTSPPDRIPAAVFSINLPVLFVWLSRLRRRRPNVVSPGFVAAGVQVLLGVALMLHENANREVITVFSGTLTFIYVIMAFISGRRTQSRPPVDAL